MVQSGPYHCWPRSGVALRAIHGSLMVDRVLETHQYLIEYSASQRRQNVRSRGHESDRPWSIFLLHDSRLPICTKHFQGVCRGIATGLFAAVEMVGLSADLYRIGRWYLARRSPKKRSVCHRGPSPGGRDRIMRFVQMPRICWTTALSSVGAETDLAGHLFQPRWCAGSPRERVNWIVSPPSVESAIPTEAGFLPLRRFTSVLSVREPGTDGRTEGSQRCPWLRCG